MAGHPNCSPTTIRRALQGRNKPVRGSCRVAPDQVRPARDRSDADTGCRVCERAPPSQRTSSPSSRRDQRGCLASQSLGGHIHIHTPPRQKPAPRASSREKQRSRAQDLLALPLKELVHEGDSRREVLHRKERANLSLSPGRQRQ